VQPQRRDKRRRPQHRSDQIEGQAAAAHEKAERQRPERPQRDPEQEAGIGGQRQQQVACRLARRLLPSSGGRVLRPEEQLSAEHRLGERQPHVAPGTEHQAVADASCEASQGRVDRCRASKSEQWRGWRQRQSRAATQQQDRRHGKNRDQQGSSGARGGSRQPGYEAEGAEQVPEPRPGKHQCPGDERQQVCPAAAA
jgi:hypothetical protein